MGKSNLSKIEQAESKTVPAKTLDRLLDLYKVTSPQTREALHALARDAQQRGWWSKYKEIFKEQALPDFEAEASLIRTFEAQMIPGLLQTPEYTEALLMGRRYTAPDTIKRKVEARMARREILHTFNPAKLRAVIDEAALRRVIGDPSTHLEQLKHLLHMAQLPNVDVQILPFSAGSHAALGAPFTILDFPDPLDLPIVYVETASDGLFLEDPDEVEQHSATFGDAQGSAMSTAHSARFITEVLNSLESYA
ncbi:helix-turn-helix transcriptional regulator [Nocardiopsis gilva]